MITYKRLWPLTISLLLSFSCSPPARHPLPEAAMTGVSLEDEIPDPSIGHAPVIIGGAGEEIGPIVPQANGGLEGPKRRLPVVAVYFLPGLHRSLAYASFLRAMEREGIRFPVACGSEFGAVVAAHYAANASPSEIEWLFHKFFERVKGKRVYDRAWMAELDQIMLGSFRAKMVEGLPSVFCTLLPRSGVHQGALAFKGALVPLLQAQFSPKASFANDPCPMEQLRQKGADIIVAVSALGETATFERPNEMTVGTYTRTIGLIERRCSGPDLLIKLPTDDMKLDQTNDFSPVLKKSLENSLSSSKMIHKLLEEWQQQHPAP